MINSIKNSNYKSKNKYLLIGAVLLFVIIYFFAIKNTINTILENTIVKQKFYQAQNAPQLLKEIQVKLNAINKNIDFNKGSFENNEQTILELVTKFCQDYRMTLLQFPKTNKTQKGEFMVETNQFVVEGTFANLLKMVYQLEQKNKMRIASIHYQLRMDNTTKQKFLVATIFIQNIKNVKI